ncbi:hypothetical protein [Streptomyces sp. NPDC051636]|uniref:hypothetical protein n=1 Tax=Streptomyces sp. NPDC051636 TaxID=3365663 RepID=UPI0037A4D08B
MTGHARSRPLPDHRLTRGASTPCRTSRRAPGPGPRREGDPHTATGTASADADRTAHGTT